MYIEKIELNNFRNYKKQEIFLDKGINIFFGDNAQGKTNIIEAIFICSLGKSFRAKKEKELIRFEEKKSSIKVNYQKKDRKGEILYKIEDKKQIFINQVSIKKMSDILGNINIVMFSPEDINLLKDGPSNRRKFINMLISQIRPNYIYQYNLYLKVLEQKNNYLKKIKEEKINIDHNLLDIYDERLSELSQKLYQYRNEFIEKIKGKINNIHQKITEEKEEIKIKYISDCENKEIFLKKLKENREHDIINGYSSKGIQRDDIYFFINGKKVDVYGSQGQQRTLILSLKIAELEIIKDEIGEYPVLLLDDFMSELDEKRKNNFLKSMKDMQIIITCTDLIEIENVKMKKYKVEAGNILEINT